MASINNVTDAGIKQLISKIKEALSGKAATSHTHTKSEVGLGNVDNTADANKSVASAARLTTARKIGISGGATGTATVFSGNYDITIPVTGMKEAYLEWGGRNVYDKLAPLDCALIEQTSSNKLSYMSPDAIAIEYSTDGGTTWVDYEASDATKTCLVTNTPKLSTLLLGKNSSASIDYQLRISLSAKTAKIYFSLRKIFVYCCTYNHDVKMNVEYSTIGDPTTFTTLLSDITVKGWSNWNSIYYGVSFGGNNSQTTQFHTLRFTFRITSLGASADSPQINRLWMVGSTSWGSTHPMQTSNRMYTIDENQLSTFAGNVKAPKFIGEVEGNASSATKATQDLAGQQINTTYIKGLSVNGKTITYTKGDGTTGSFDTQDTDTTYDVATASANGLMSSADKSKLDSLSAPTTYTATFTADGWVGDAAPYTQSVTVSGVKADTKLIGMPDARECADADTEKAMKKAYGYLTYFETSANTITATAKFEKPTVDISVIFEGV